MFSRERGISKGVGGAVLQFQQQQLLLLFFFYCSAYLEKSLFLSLCPSSTQVPELVFATGGESLIVNHLCSLNCLPYPSLSFGM